MKAFLLIAWFGSVLVGAATFAPPVSSASGVTVDPTTHILIFPTDLSSANGFGGAGSIEGTNLGTGWHMFAQKTGAILQFNTITNDAWLATSSNGNTLTIALSTQFKTDVNATSNSVLITLAGLVTTSNQVATVQAGLVVTSNRVETVNTAAVPTTRTLNTTAPLTGGGDLSANRTLALAASSDSVAGYLSAADHATFNGKAGPANKLSFFAATTSAEFFGVISDESGSGSVLGGTSPTITTPTISGAIAFPAGTRQTFAPNGTASGFNPGSVAGDPSTLVNGDIWYDSSGSHLRARIAGVTVSLGTGGGAGTVGTMISTGASTTTSVPGYTDTTSTNLAPVETSGTGLIARTFAPALTNVTVRTNLIVNYPGTGVASLPGITVTNSTAAASGAQQGATLALAGNGFATDTSTSQSVIHTIRSGPTEAGASPSGKLWFELAVNGGSVTTLGRWDANGDFNPTGGVIAGGGIIAGATMYAQGAFMLNFNSNIRSSADGKFLLQNGASSGFTSLTLGPESSSFPQMKVSGAGIDFRVGDDTAFTATQSLYDRFGSGSPESVVTAPIGATYHRTNGGANTSLYVKESGTGNTGWIAK